jgi:hypothetical protein
VLLLGADAIARLQWANEGVDSQAWPFSFGSLSKDGADNSIACCFAPISTDARRPGAHPFSSAWEGFSAGVLKCSLGQAAGTGCRMQHGCMWRAHTT